MNRSCEEKLVNYKWNIIGGSNYDSLFVRTVAFPVQFSRLLDQRGHSPPQVQCPMSTLTSGPET